MNDEVINLINQAVESMIDKTSSDKKLEKLAKTQSEKIHFIPKKYRIFGGLLQSLNIQFGSFLEELMTLLIASDGRYEILTEFSGKKNNSFELSQANDIAIDSYITRCQTQNFDLDMAFIDLLKQIQEDADDNLSKFKHDIDVLFKNKETGEIFYLECKYNDDHDTGKFIDINRKFIKTYAYLSRQFHKVDNNIKITPILFYFNNKKMKGNIYVPENTHIRRGQAFFDEFLHVKYEDVDNYMQHLSESPEIIESFHQLYQKVMSSNL